MPEEDIQFVEDKPGSTKKAEFEWIVRMALNRIHSLCTYGQTEKQSILNELPRRIGYGVKMLEAIMSPYVDDEYREEIKSRKETKGGEDQELDKALFKLGALSRLLDRWNMLMERYAEDVIE